MGYKHWVSLAGEHPYHVVDNVGRGEVQLQVEWRQMMLFHIAFLLPSLTKNSIEPVPQAAFTL